MNIRVRLLSLPSPDWTTYVHFVSEVVGISPTRGNDERKEIVGSPSSFLSSLKDLLKEKAGKHYLINFVAHIPIEMLLKLYEYDLEISHIATDKKENEFLVFISGVLIDFKKLLTEGSRDDDLRLLCDKIAILLDQQNLIILKRKELNDGTFLIME